MLDAEIHENTPAFQGNRIGTMLWITGIPAFMRWEPQPLPHVASTCPLRPRLITGVVRRCASGHEP